MMSQRTPSMGLTYALQRTPTAFILLARRKRRGEKVKQENLSGLQTLLALPRLLFIHFLSATRATAHFSQALLGGSPIALTDGSNDRQSPRLNGVITMTRSNLL